MPLQKSMNGLMFRGRWVVADAITEDMFDSLEDLSKLQDSGRLLSTDNRIHMTDGAWTKLEALIHPYSAQL